MYVRRLYVCFYVEAGRNTFYRQRNKISEVLPGSFTFIHVFLIINLYNFPQRIESLIFKSFSVVYILSLKHFSVVLSNNPYMVLFS